MMSKINKLNKNNYITNSFVIVVLSTVVGYLIGRLI